MVEEARGAIDARAVWTPAERVDHLAVLWFVAEAEGVPTRLMRAAISKERLMESEWYREIFGDGEASGRAAGEASGRAAGRAAGKAEGNAEGKAEAILAVLAARSIPVSATIRARILGCSDTATLDAWVRRAAVASTAAAVVRAKAPARPAAGPARHAQKT